MNQRHDKLAEALECCREGDLDRLEELPELKDLAAAVESDQDLAARLSTTQGNDALVADALRETDCPAGLAERIAARIAAADASIADASIANAGPDAGR